MQLTQAAMVSSTGNPLSLDSAPAGGPAPAAGGLRQVAARMVRRTADHLATSPGGLRFSANAYDWLESLGSAHTPAYLQTPEIERNA